MTIAPNERDLLRDLAKRVAEVAALPVQEKRRALWKRHNALQPARPMILVFPEGSWQELLPGSALTCENPEARNIEWQLRHMLYYHEHIPDDTVIESSWTVRKAIHETGWGLEAKRHDSTEARGAWSFEPVLKDESDLEKITTPVVTVDEAATERHMNAMEDLFGDILEIRLKGVAHISFHLMNQYTGWRGLEETLLDMMDEPEFLHKAMRILTDAHLERLRQLVELNLLSLNNDGTYHASGGIGYTDELPAEGFDPARVRLCDMWGSAEAQEMASVGPTMHREFVMEYEKELLAPFALTGYGCCEDLTHKLGDAMRLFPNLRRPSISPWADVTKCAEILGDRYIFSWKPQPAHLCGEFNTAHIRKYIRETLAATRGCVLEMVLKDTHTCDNHPERFTEWVRIAREEIDAACGASA